ncbi:MAG: hypothetical protein JEZ09_08165 [Salinivirgaceae bacterium]|nr:hypothetical protein [Salinivirgaceae bacterium]
MDLSFIKKLEVLQNNSSNYSECLYSLNISGSEFNEFWEQIEQVKLIFDNYIILKINGEQISFNDIQDYKKIPNYKWDLILNKSDFLINNKSSKYNYTFFLQSNFLLDSLKDINPLDEDCILNKVTGCNIFVSNLDGYLKGPYLNILPLNSDAKNYETNFNLPTIEEIREHVNFITSDRSYFSPLKFYITEVQQNEMIANEINRCFAQTISIALIDEYHHNNKGVINGIKRIECKLFENFNEFSIDFQNNLLSLVQWLYDERIETRKRLFSERISLEFEKGDNFLYVLFQHFKDIFSQIKEQYNFVILDRKDDYFKEKRDLLNDLKKQSDLHSQKIRQLLNGLLRDILASFILTGFTVFTKFQSGAIYGKLTVPILFKGLAIYYVLSLVLQSIINISDVNTSKKEIFYWKNLTRNHIPKNEFEEEVKKAMSFRKNNLRLSYSIIIIIYLFIAFIAWNFEKFLALI